MDSAALVDDFFDKVFGREPDPEPEPEIASPAPSKAPIRHPGPSPRPLEDKTLADLDTRLATADYYRAILTHEFWELDNAVAKLVHAEISTFVRQRLQELLGVSRPQPQQFKPQFENEEVSVLRALAKKMLSGALNKGEAQPSSAPVPAPPQPLVSETEPVEYRPKPKLKSVRSRPPRPQVKFTEPQPEPTPETDEPKGPDPVPEHLRTSLQPSKAEIETARRQGSLVQQFQAPALDPRTGKTKMETYTYIEGKVFEDGGRKYVIKRNNNGFLYRHNVSGQTLPANYSPPTTDELATVSASLADATTRAQARATKQVLLGQQAPASASHQVDTVSFDTDSSSNLV